MLGVPPLGGVGTDALRNPPPRKLVSASARGGFHQSLVRCFPGAGPAALAGLIKAWQKQGPHFQGNSPLFF